MTEISASIVKELRELTGVGMMDCKKALMESNGDLEQAKEYLRKKGLSNINKKSDRITADGLIAVAANENKLALITLNSETDFVAKNEKFAILAHKIANFALQNNTTVDALNMQFAEEITNNISVLGENIKLTNVDYLSVKKHGVIAFYIHNALNEYSGKIISAVVMESDKEVPHDAMKNLAKQICMHITAAKPEALSIENLNPERLQREVEFVTEQAKSSGKPEAVLNKVIEGRIRKFYEEVVLLEQVFIVDTDKTVSGALAALGKEMQCNIQLTGFLRFSL